MKPVKKLLKDLDIMRVIDVSKKKSKTRKRNSDEEFHNGFGRTDKGLWRKWNAGYADKQAEGGER